MIDDTNSSQLAGSQSINERQLWILLEQILVGEGFLYERHSLKERGLELKTPGPCPDPGVWIALTTQESMRPRAEALLAHAAICSKCCALLRFSQGLLGAAASPEEKAELAKFASLDWQQSMARKLAVTPIGLSQVTMLSLTRWIGIGAAVAAVLIFSLILGRREIAPEKLLAQAYTENRPFDLRLAGARYAPLIVEGQKRGPRSEHENRSLMRADSEIQLNLKQNPSSRRWPQLNARSELLSGRYDDAIDILDDLLTTGPITGGLLLDAGSAYFLRGSAAGITSDRVEALDYLRRADDLAPGTPEILFDEAIVMEDNNDLIDAAQVWSRYLKLETDPQWLAEGRSRLQSLQDRLERTRSGMAPRRK
jgi:tetratricopeptide (TPR) repeat protein